MKEPFFNDISAQPLCSCDEEVHERIAAFVKLLEFCGSIGFEKVRFEKPFQEILLKKNYTLYEYILENGYDNSARLILSMVRKPYLDEDTDAEEKYVNSVVRLEKDGEEIEAEGLACAYLADGFAIGFASEDFWKNNTAFNLTVFNQTTKNKAMKQVFCISDVKQFEIQDFIDWAVETLPIKFKRCNISSEKKSYHFRDDHGKDKLEAFAKRLLKEEYIVEVINSLNYQPHAKNMIGNVSDDGLIDIILTDTDKGLGMVIKTTAETRRLALYMAADIRKKYS